MLYLPNLLKNPSFEEVNCAATPDGGSIHLFGTDLAASYLADPRYAAHTPTSMKVLRVHTHSILPCRVSYDALYSVRLISPEVNNSYGSHLYPVSVTGGTVYQLSAHLYAVEPGITVLFTASGPLTHQGELMLPFSLCHCK